MARTSRWLPLLSLGRVHLTLARSPIPRSPRRSGSPRTGAKCADDPECHNRWHPAIKPVATADPGDIVVFGTRDAFDHSLDRNSTPADVAAAEPQPRAPADRAAVRATAPRRATCSRSRCSTSSPTSSATPIIVPGFGFLRDVFPDPFIVRWDLTRRGATSPDMPGVNIRFDGFMGTIGVAPGPNADRDLCSSARRPS